MNALIEGEASGIDSVVADSRPGTSFNEGGAMEASDKSEGFLPEEDEVPNEDNNELPSEKICDEQLSESQATDDLLILSDKKMEPNDPRPHSFGGECEVVDVAEELEIITSNEHVDPAKTGSCERQSEEVNGTGCPDEEARRQFGIISEIEIPISMQKFNKLVDKLNSARDDNIDELERQFRLGKRFLSQFNRKKKPQLIDKPDSECIDEENDEHQNSPDDNGFENDQPQTSSAIQRGRKRKAVSHVAKKRISAKANTCLGGRQEDNECMPKDDDINHEIPSDRVDKLRTSDCKLTEEADAEKDNDSAISDDIPPPPKLTRAQLKKNLEIKKLFRQANRAMIDDDDDEEEEGDEQTGTLSNDDGEQKLENRQLGRRGTLHSSSSEIVIDSDEEATMKSEEDGSDDDYKTSGKNGPKRRKITSDGYEVLTLGDRPFASSKRTAKPKQKAPKRQRKPPTKKLKASRKNRHLASDEENDDDEGNKSDGSHMSGTSDALEVPSSDEEVPKTNSSKKVIAKKDLTIETKEAERAEKERRRRLEERQKEFNGIELVTNESSDNATTTLVYKGEGSQPVLKAIVLDPDSESDSPDPVRVHPSLVRILKRHQADGIRFIYNCTIESLSRLDEPGGGAILGHCMGLGKTLQIIAFLHTILSHPRISESIHKVLVFAPKNALLNWINEFDKWLFDNDPELDGVLTYSEIDSLTDNSERLLAIKRWAGSKKPSVLVIGYDMFRRLTEFDSDKSAPKRRGRPPKPKNKTKTEKELDRLRPQFRSYLFEAPHLIICDEGHKLKNYESLISKTINRIVARRRVCLTGTPLQNNLSEYYCMVNFVKPNLLGNIKEFKSRFELIINRGRTVDASRQDVAHMKRRCHVLHDRLRGILDRRDYTVLKESLPPKQEYVLMIRLTQPQIGLYRQFLEFADRNQTLNGHCILPNHIILYRIWTHPYLIIEHEREEERKQLMMDDDDFVVPDNEDQEDDDEEDEDDDEVTEIVDGDRPSTSTQLIPSRRSRRQKCESPDERVETPIELKEWAKNRVTEEDRNRFELSNKLMLLVEIIKKCEAIGDKLLVFSQFLNSIALIRRMLAYYADSGKWFVDGHDALMRQDERWSWKFGRDYDIIDGAVSSKDRDRIQRELNDPLNLRKRLLLISTRAGSLGINLVGANRVVIFDCCWNPSHDTQSLFRVYRFGQEKPVYIYRFVAQGTMEERIYNRQVTKESTARRVTEAAQIQRHYKVEDLELMYRFEPELLVEDADSCAPHLDPPKDRLLGDIILSGTKAITSYHTHDLLLTSIEEEQLTPEEREEAWKEYERERQPRQQLPPLSLVAPILNADGTVIPGTSQPPLAPIAGMTNFSNAALLLNHQLQAFQALQIQKQQETARSGEIGYFMQTMGQLTVAYNNDPIYKLCFQVPGMQAKTAYRIFQIKQFLSYFVNLIPPEDLGEMNNANAFANYFNGILQKAIQEKLPQESVEEKAMITLATTIEIARPHPGCQAGILFIKRTFPEVMRHLDQTQ